jgi:hypothetical protein
VIAYQTPAPAPAPALETDKARILATAMLELEAQGRTVDLDALDGWCPGLTRAEIVAHADDAAAIAKQRKRGDA